METKTLNTIQTFSKIGKIISRISFIFCLIGVVGCTIGLACLGAGLAETVSFGNVTIHGIISNTANLTMGTLYTSLAVALVLCLGEAIVAKMTSRYFVNELADGTPFTFRGAAELKRLGICTIFIPFVTMIIAQVVYAVSSHVYEDVADMHIDNFASNIGVGIIMIFFALILRYGAEIREMKGMPEEITE